MKLTFFATLLAALPIFAAETITTDVALDAKSLKEIGIAYTNREGRDDNLGKNYTDHKFRFTEQKLGWRQITDTVLDNNTKVIAASMAELDRDAVQMGDEEAFTFNARVYEDGEVSHMIEFHEAASVGAHCFRVLIKPNQAKQAGGEQPATGPDSKPGSKHKSQPESKPTPR